MKFKNQEEFDGHIATLVGKTLDDRLAPFMAERSNFHEKMLEFTMDGGRASAAHAATAEQEKGLGIARIARALGAMKGNPYAAAEWAKRAAEREKWSPEMADGITKALAASDGAAGGFLVPEVFSTDVIEFLRPRTIIRRAGPRILPMPTGTTSVPRITSGTSASYIGENSNAPATALGTGQVTLTWKKLAALVPISNDLLRFSSPSADTIVRDDLASAMAQREDLAFIRGDGLSGTPKGLLNWCPTSQKLPANATVNLANVTADLESLITALENASIKFVNPLWIFSPRSKNYLMTAMTSTGAFAFRDEMLRGQFWGWNFAWTQQIPTNLGGGSDSEVYLVDLNDAVLGEASSMIIDASNEAAYFDGSNVVSAFSLDQTVIRAIEQHDFVMRHDAAVAMLTGVKW